MLHSPLPVRHKLIIDVDAGFTRTGISITQGNNLSHVLEIRLMHGTSVIAIPSNASIHMTYRKPDDTVGFVEGTVQNGEAIITLTDQFSAADGPVVCTLEASEFDASVSEDVYVSGIFVVNANRAPITDVESHDEFTAMILATDRANGAAEDAAIAASYANAKGDMAQQAADNANTAADRVDAAIEEAEDAANAANSAASSASNAASSANSAASEALIAANDATLAADRADESGAYAASKAVEASSAAASAESAASAALEAASGVEEAISNAEEATDAANASASSANAASASANTAAENANDAADYAEGIADDILAAKERGDFDGKDGEDGEDGEDGRSAIISGMTAVLEETESKVPSIEVEMGGDNFDRTFKLTFKNVVGDSDAVKFVTQILTEAQKIVARSNISAASVDAVNAIEALIPNEATSSNKLADRGFVNSTVSTNTANFIGTFDSVAQLEAYTGTKTNNDYAFVKVYDPVETDVVIRYDRYKWSSTTNTWKFEYSLNNSSFTADQWAAINSMATANLIEQISINAETIGDISGELSGKVDGTQVDTVMPEEPASDHVPATSLFKTSLDSKEDISNKVSQFQATPDNTHYPTEKLVKDSLGTKQDKDSDAVEGDIAQFDANGNAVDAGFGAGKVVLQGEGSITNPITTLENSNGDVLIPMTLEQAVSDGNGVTLDDKLAAMSLSAKRVSKIAPFYYNAHFKDINYADGYEYYEKYKPSVGACSVVVNGNIVGRNYDWYYDNRIIFVCHTLAEHGRHDVIGNAAAPAAMTEAIVDSGEPNENYKYIPFLLLDGVNDAGLFCELNVVTDENGTTTGTNPEGEDMFAMMVPRYVLDYASTVDEALDLIRSKNIYCADGSGFKEEFHILLKDFTKTVVVEFVENELSIVESFPESKPIMTNFFLTDFDGTKATMTPYGQGWERYQILANGFNTAGTIAGMQALMNEVKYTKAYTDLENVWYSEFAGNWGSTYGDLTKDSPPSAYAAILADARTKYANRSRATGETWHSVHSAVYDINERKFICIPQESGKAYTFKMGEEGVVYETEVDLSAYRTSADQDVIDAGKMPLTPTTPATTIPLATEIGPTSTDLQVPSSKAVMNEFSRVSSGTMADALYHLGFYLDENGELCEYEGDNE